MTQEALWQNGHLANRGRIVSFSQAYISIWAEGKTQDGTQHSMISQFLRKCRSYGLVLEIIHGFHFTWNFGKCNWLYQLHLKLLQLKFSLFLLWAIKKNCSMIRVKD